jgi:hypothetical protein
MELAQMRSDLVFFNPVTAWLNANMANAAEIDRCNRAVICISDGVLANLGGPGMGFGTIREIEFARSQGLPVAVVQGENTIHSLCKHDVLVADTLEEGLGMLRAEISNRRAVAASHA